MTILGEDKFSFSLKMTNTSEVQNSNAASPSLDEVLEVIAQFEEYRERLISDAMETAKRAKMKKSEINAQIEPELNKIDSALEQLKAQRDALKAA